MSEKHPLINLLMGHKKCNDDVVDIAAILLEKLIELHDAAGDDWDEWMDIRSIEWFDEVTDLLRPFEDDAKNLPNKNNPQS